MSESIAPDGRKPKFVVGQEVVLIKICKWDYREEYEQYVGEHYVIRSISHVNNKGFVYCLERGHFGAYECELEALSFEAKYANR